MDDLPDLPFEKVLSYLELGERIKCRAVAKRWLEMIDSLPVASLFYSDKPSDFIFDKHRLVIGLFAHNYIASAKFEPFFGHFSRSILCNLRNLRVCDLLDLKERSSAFEAILNSLEHLQTLDLIAVTGLDKNLNLRLPKLQSIRLQDLDGVQKLTLSAPNLTKIQISQDHPFTLHLVHPESVCSVSDNNYFHLAFESLKNLDYLCCELLDEISDDFLANHQKLKEIHLNGRYEAVEALHDQKRRLGRTELKIYYLGLCLDSAGDHFLFRKELNEEILTYLSENYSRLAEELPLARCIKYGSEMQDLVPDEFWRRLIHLKRIVLMGRLNADTGVRNFLEFLKKFDHIPQLLLYTTNQQLLDQLPAYCPVLSVQTLTIGILNLQLDFTFLFSFKNLLDLHLASTNPELFPRLFEELRFLRTFHFRYKPKGFDGNGHEMTIKVEEPMKRYRLSAEVGMLGSQVHDLSEIADAINFLYLLSPMEGEVWE